MQLEVTNYSNGEKIDQGVLNRPINQIVDYINNLNLNEYLVDRLEISVGPGGDFSRLGDALLFAARFTPTVPITTSQWNQGASAQGIITLKSGFTLNESVIARGLQLGWCRIESEDAFVPVTVSGLSAREFEGSSKFVGITVRAGTTFPTIAFSMVASGSRNNTYLLHAADSSIITVGSNVSIQGISGTGSSSATISTGSYLYLAPTSEMTGRILLTDTSRATLTGSSVGSIEVQDGSIVSAGNTSGSLNISPNTVTRQGIIFQ